MTAILWHEEVGAWLDYDMLNEIKRDYFYPTNISPLWTGCYDPKKTDDFVSRTLKYLEKTQIMNNLGGIPTTLEHSGEQWDYPNAWPPLQYIMVMSLDASGDNWAQDLAFEIAERWMRSNYKAYNETNAMYEKVSLGWWLKQKKLILLSGGGYYAVYELLFYINMLYFYLNFLNYKLIISVHNNHNQQYRYINVWLHTK